MLVAPAPSDAGINLRTGFLLTTVVWLAAAAFAGLPFIGVGLNYADHVAPLWTIDRGANTCTHCHNDNNPDNPVSKGLDLRDIVSGTGRMLSYEELMVGDPVIDPETGLERHFQIDDLTETSLKINPKYTSTAQLSLLHVPVVHKASPVFVYPLLQVSVQLFPDGVFGHDA